MIPEGWLHPALILLDLAAATVGEVLAQVARTAAPLTGVDAARIEAALAEVTRGGGFALGHGVAVPHADIPGLDETAVALVRTRQPVAVPAPDGQPADLFFVVLSRPRDPRQHLLLLAHVARLSQSRVLLDALRQAGAADEALALVQAASLRHTAAPVPAAPPPPANHYLAVIAVAGERTTDALLVSLLDQGLGDAAVLETQSVREAATREVPLFAGFRDLLGDPGGLRLIVAEVAAERVDALTSTVRRVLEDSQEEQRVGGGRFLLLPLHARWAWAPAASAPEDGEHAGGH